MNAINCKTANWQQRLTGSEPDGSWIVEDGQDQILVWLAADGIHAKRFGKTSKGKLIEHAEQVLKWDDAIARAEGQALLFKA